MHLNHSYEPNLGVQGQITFVALCDIAADEELTFDYAMTDGRAYEMECNCGTPTCRKVITGHDRMKQEMQRKYDGYFSWFIQRRLDVSSMNQAASPAREVPDAGRWVCPGRASEDGEESTI